MQLLQLHSFLLFTFVLFQNVLATPTGAGNWWSCLLSGNIRIRKDWGDMSRQERLSYLGAVKCLNTKPSKFATYDPAKFGGLKSRWDDFVALHVMRTPDVHQNGVFLSWHRNFIYLMETAMRDECGYKGALAYWNWPRYNGKLESSPIFDGSDTSFSGDGAFAPPPPGNFTPPGGIGSGGGCVLKGPFVGFNLSIAPVDLPPPSPGSPMVMTVPLTAYAYKPHCLTRNLNNAVGLKENNLTTIQLLQNAPTIKVFQDILDVPPTQVGGAANSTNNSTTPTPGGPGGGPPGVDDFIGPHGGGHGMMGGDGTNPFSSPNDPVFFLHHAMVDKMWSDWQLRDPIRRVYGDNAISGTHTAFNTPPSPNMTRDDIQDFGPLYPKYKVGELLNVIAGPFCYIYR